MLGLTSGFFPSGFPVKPCEWGGEQTVEEKTKEKVISLLRFSQTLE